MERPQCPPAERQIPRWAWPLGIVLGGFGFVTLYMLIAMWPSVVHATASNGAGPTGTTGPTGASGTAAAALTSTNVDWFGWTVSLSTDVALLVVVVLAAALGGFVYEARSFATYVGNRQLKLSWLWWYLLQSVTGSGLALVFYFAFRGGFLSTTSGDSSINPYGVAALAGLVGLFSKQASDKLQEVFETLFQTKPGYGDDARSDSLAPTPNVTGPCRIAVKQTTLTLTGEGFVDKPKVQVAVGDSAPGDRDAAFVNDKRLIVTLDPKDVENAGTITVTVTNPDGKASSAFKILVEGPAPEAPAPQAPAPQAPAPEAPGPEAT
jgi:hypothetical protein